MSVPLCDDTLDRELAGALHKAFKELDPGPVLILPPDLTRIHSRSGFLAGVICRELACRQQTAKEAWSLGAIMPALGTHRPLSPAEIALMFPLCPAETFVHYHWRTDTVELGRLEADWVETAFTAGQGSIQQDRTASAFHLDWPVQVNRILRDGLPCTDGLKPFSLIVSIGQVVPHEVAGMANHAKNIFIGTGGPEAIHKSHWLGALYGLERLMGITENPVRSLFDEALRCYGHLLPPILWVLTVVDSKGSVRGLFCGFGRECFEKAAALSKEVNIERVTTDGGIRKAVVWLDGNEYRSAWLGNKAIYRTRRAMADGGELLILAPGLECFGEDPGLDALIRRYGYRGAAAIQEAVKTENELAANLGAAAHLIHGSSEGRFTIRYCTPGGNSSSGKSLLGRSDFESAAYEWGSLEEAVNRYVPLGPEKQQSGWNTTADGEKYFFIRNPGMGLWTV